MSDVDRLYERLSAADPAADINRDPDSVVAQHLRHRIRGLTPEFHRDVRGRPRTRRQVATTFAAALVALAALGGVGLARWGATPVVEDQTVGCYATAARDSNVTIVGADGRDPADICADYWRQGLIADQRTDVPPLTVCVTVGGAPAVLPTGDPDPCPAAGMRELGGRYTAEEEVYLAVRDALRDRLPVNGCVDLPTASRTARQILADLDLPNWAVVEKPTAVLEDGLTGTREEVSTDCYDWSIASDASNKHGPKTVVISPKL